MPGRPPFPTPLPLIRRARAERWILDRARQTGPARAARLAIEKRNVRARVRQSGSVDVALDQMVADAIAQGAESSAATQS